MSSTNLNQTLASFQATIHDSNNRQVSIPARIQRQLGLLRRRDNHIVRASIRRAGSGYWNHHYFKLTGDNEFSIPSDVTGMRRGDVIDVKIHAIIADVPVVPSSTTATATEELLALAARERAGWRTDGSARVDEYLREDEGA